MIHAFVGIFTATIGGIAVFLTLSLANHEPQCQEDEALYKVLNGRLAFPEGEYKCVNIEELR
jgi:hypothetical protein